jgi:hypothetical protein
MDRYENDTILFQTHDGTTGMVEPNYVGNMDIWIGETVVYEIEKNLFDMLEYDRKEVGLIEFYNFVKTVDSSEFKGPSRIYYDIVKTSTENIILNYNLPLVGSTTIDTTQIHYTENEKIKISLN